MPQIIGGLTLMLGIALLVMGIRAFITRRAAVRNNHPTAAIGSTRPVTGRAALNIGILYLVLAVILVISGLLLLSGEM